MTDQVPQGKAVDDDPTSPPWLGGNDGDVDADVEACWFFAWDYLEVLLQVPEDHIATMVEDFLVELSARAIQEVQIIANEFTSVTAHVLEHMDIDRADFPLQAAIEDIVNLKVIDPDQDIEITGWLAELRWRGATSWRFRSEDPVFRAAMTGSTITHPEVVDEAHVALACALMAAHSLDDPGTALATYLTCHEEH